MSGRKGGGTGFGDSASHGGSGEAVPDEKMSPVRTPRNVRTRGSGMYRLRETPGTPNTAQRQAAQRKANAKRRRRDRPTEETP